MEPVEIERLPFDIRELVHAYLLARPHSFAARVHLRIGLHQKQWRVVYASMQGTRIVGFGPTVTSALAAWETNYREAAARHVRTMA